VADEPKTTPDAPVSPATVLATPPPGQAAAAAGTGVTAVQGAPVSPATVGGGAAAATPAKKLYANKYETVEDLEKAYVAARTHIARRMPAASADAILAAGAGNAAPAAAAGTTATAAPAQPDLSRPLVPFDPTQYDDPAAGAVAYTNAVFAQLLQGLAPVIGRMQRDQTTAALDSLVGEFPDALELHAEIATIVKDNSAIKAALAGGEDPRGVMRSAYFIARGMKAGEAMVAAKAAGVEEGVAAVAARGAAAGVGATGASTGPAAVGDEAAQLKASLFSTTPRKGALAFVRQPLADEVLPVK